MFETKRLVFRKPVRQDFDRLWEMRNDPAAKEYTGGVTKLTYRERLRLFEEECAGEFTPQGAEFAVIGKESGLYLGYCGFRYSQALEGCEFLFGYHRDSWGNGLATEAALAVLRYLFLVYPHPSYVATVDPRNTASRRVLEKAGFQRVDGLPGLQDEPVEVYRILKQDLKE